MAKMNTSYLFWFKRLLTIIVSLSWPLACIESHAVSQDPCDVEHNEYWFTIPEPHCLAEQLDSFSDWEVEENGDVVVYLTDLTEVNEARKLIEPFYKLFRDQRWMGMGKLLFEKTDYNYKQLEQWRRQLEENPQMPNSVAAYQKFGGDHITQLVIFHGKISISADYESTIEKIKRFIKDQKYPIDVFEFSSREAEIKNIASIAPTLQIRENKTLILLPAVHWNNDVAGELILGVTNMNEVGNMLPAWPGHGPSKVDKGDMEFPTWVTDGVKAVVKKIKYSYNPRATHIITGFDSKRRLIFVRYQVQQGQGERLRSKLWEIAAFKVIHKENESIIHQASIGECITIEATEGIPYWSNELKISLVTYFYNCD